MANHVRGEGWKGARGEEGNGNRKGGGVERQAGETSEDTHIHEGREKERGDTPIQEGREKERRDKREGKRNKRGKQAGEARKGGE